MLAAAPAADAAREPKLELALVGHAHLLERGGGGGGGGPGEAGRAETRGAGSARSR